MNNTKKRKAEDDDCDPERKIKLDVQEKDEIEIENTNQSDCGSDNSCNSLLGQQKSDNGGVSQEPDSSEKTNIKMKKEMPSEDSSEQIEEKQIMNNTKKQKAENDDHDSERKTKPEFQVKDEIEIENTNQSDCGNEDFSCDTLSEQKSDNGSLKQEPGSSENTDLEVNKDPIEKKQIKTDPSKPAGTLLFSGGTNWDLIGRKELPKTAKGAVGPNLWGPHRLGALNGIRVTYATSSCTSCHSVILTEDGRLMTWGRNDKGQLGLGDNNRRDNPCLVEALAESNIISAACGRSHTLFLSGRGIVYSTGDNKMGQCGIGSQNNAINSPKKITFKGRPINKIACGAEFSVIIDSRGGVYSFGCPEYGQLGHNSDGRYFVTSNKLSFRCELIPRRVIAFIEKTREGHVTLVDDVHIADVACGINHCVAVDLKKRCFSWGYGGYGRLGHAEQKDELVPRLVKTFDGPNRGVKRVYAGGTYSMAINEFDVLLFWGQNKRAGEATMYPKPVQDLTGWSVRLASCSFTSIVVLADESVISWGACPTYGELCYGESKCKSSTTPQEAKTLDGLHIMSISCGCGHTLLIARDETEEDRRKLESFPEFTP